MNKLKVDARSSFAPSNQLSVTPFGPHLRPQTAFQVRAGCNRDLPHTSAAIYGSATTLLHLSK